MRFECVIECQVYYVNECGTEFEIVHQSKIRFECVIKCETECEIVHQSKRRFECVIECETECEIVHQSKIVLELG